MPNSTFQILHLHPFKTSTIPVTPAQAGVQWNLQVFRECHWIPAFAGMTGRKAIELFRCDSHIILLIGLCLFITACNSSQSMPVLSQKQSDITEQSQFQPNNKPVDTRLITAFDQAIMQVTKLNYALVVNLFDDLSTQFTMTGAPDRASESAFWHAFCLEKLDQIDKAIAVYDRIIKTWPQSKACLLAMDRRNNLQGESASPTVKSHPPAQRTVSGVRPSGNTHRP